MDTPLGVPGISTLFSASSHLERSTGTVTPVACISAKVLSVFSILSASRIGARKPSPESWMKIQAATAKALDCTKKGHCGIHIIRVLGMLLTLLTPMWAGVGANKRGNRKTLLPSWHPNAAIFTGCSQSPPTCQTFMANNIIVKQVLFLWNW